jgi:hypothetical protein
MEFLKSHPNIFLVCISNVGPGNSVNQLTLGLSGVYSEINSVAINETGVGLIGGSNDSNAAYAALVSSDQSSPTVVLSGLPSTTSSYIASVGINNSGSGIIGGTFGNPSSDPGYAALVSPGGQVTPLSVNISKGNINSVAINDAGVGLIGGLDAANLSPYAALVAPGGQVTPLNLQIPAVGIFSVAINDGILDEATPKSISSNWGVFNSQFAASFALNSHMTAKHRSTNEVEHQDLASLASADDNLPISSGAVEKNSKKPSTVWVAPFGNYVHQKAEGASPTSNNSIGGFLLGYDYSYSDLMFGGALGYAYNYMGFGSGNHGSVQEELATFYGSYERDYLLVNFALWGGFYELYNKRNTLSVATSKGNTEGWIFSPHLEIASPFKRGISFEPFVMLDYVNNWQGGYTEKGSSGLNLIVDKHYSSVLRSEAGLRLFEEWDIKRGKFVFGQKVSYVNQAPFYFGPVTTSFVASASSFPIAIGASHVQNLGALELNASFLPWNEKYPYVSFGVQAEAGSSYQSYFGNIEIGKSF